MVLWVCKIINECFLASNSRHSGKRYSSNCLDNKLSDTGLKPEQDLCTWKAVQKLGRMQKQLKRKRSTKSGHRKIVSCIHCTLHNIILNVPQIGLCFGLQYRKVPKAKASWKQQLLFCTIWFQRSVFSRQKLPTRHFLMHWRADHTSECEVSDPPTMCLWRRAPAQIACGGGVGAWSSEASPKWAGEHPAVTCLLGKHEIARGGGRPTWGNAISSPILWSGVGVGLNSYIFF